MEIRQSLGTNTWDAAQEALDRLKNNRAPEPAKVQDEPKTIEYATERYLADAHQRNLQEATIYKYRLLFSQLKSFADKKGLRYVKQLDLEMLREFREGWKDGPRSRVKKLERLRSWLKFCVESKWADENHARNLKVPKVEDRPTLPFSREEMAKILAAFEAYGKSAGLANAQRLKAFVLVLRYSGMRIGDCVKCSVERIDGNRLFLYTQKTGTPVRCVLPDFVLQELEAAPKSSGGYFF